MTRLPCHDLFLRLFVHVSKNPPNSPVKRGATPCAGHMVLVARSPFRAAALRMAGQHPRTRRQAGARRPPHLGSLIAVCPEILHLIRRHPPDSLCDESEEHLPCETIWICFFIMVSRLDGLTPAFTSPTRAVCGRMNLARPPKRYGGHVCLKLRSAGWVFVQCVVSKPCRYTLFTGM